MIAHRIDGSNAEAITNRAVRGAPPTLHHDVVFAAKIYNVPDDQKIPRESELSDERQFFFELAFHRTANCGVTLLRAEPNDRAQERIHRVTVRHRKFRKFITKIFQRKHEALSQARRVFNRFRQIAKKFAHLTIAFQITLGVLR